MTFNSKIEWTDHTFNPWLGCTKVGPGCDHCYAEAMMDRRMHKVRWGAGQPRVRTSAANWQQPLRWNAQAAREGRRFRVFCASLADVFDNEVPGEWRIDLFSLIAQTPHLDWLLLTKRIGNVIPMCSRDSLMFDMICERVWLGATVCNQEEADRDIPKLLATPAAVRFLSIEPMLGPVDLTEIPRIDHEHPHPAHYDLADIDWVIVGGESGPKARPTDVEHIRSIVQQCHAAGVAVFVKQLGSNIAPLVIDAGSVRERLFLRHSKGGDPSEWPKDLRVREFPRLDTESVPTAVDYDHDRAQ